MADPTPVPVIAPFAKRSAILHIGLGIVALLCQFASGFPQLAAYRTLLTSIASVIGVACVAAARAYLGPRILGILEAVSPTPSAPQAAPPNAGAIVAAQSARVLIPFLIVGTLLSGCPAPSPIPTSLDGGSPSYLTAFESCLKNDGITDATNLGAQIFQILDNGAGSAQGIESAIEQVLVTAGGQGAILVATCAVDAYDAAHPIAAKAKPTPSQGAIRLFRVKHMVAPTVHHG